MNARAAIPHPVPGLIRLRTALNWARQVSNIAEGLCVDCPGPFRPLFVETRVIAITAISINGAVVTASITHDQDLQIMRVDTTPGAPNPGYWAAPLPPHLRRKEPMQ